jgi:hypothetical protein
MFSIQCGLLRDAGGCAYVRNKLTVEEIYPEPAHNLDEQSVNVLKRLVISYEGFNKLPRGIEELLWQNSLAY